MFIFRCKQEVPVDCHKLKETIALLDGHETGLKFLSSLLQKCSAAKELLEGKKLHCYLQKNGLLKNLLLGNHLLRMYLSCGSSEDAIACFYSLHEKNGFSWNSLITAHARDGQYQKAICVFYRMQCEGFLPDEFVFASVVSACTKRATITYGKHIHTQILGNEVEFSVPVLNALANMYACHNSITVARKLFDQMLHRNVVSWTCMISAYARIGQCEDAHSLHVRMCQEVALPNRVTYSILLDACLTPDCLVRGRQLHACITTCNLHFDIIMATSLVIMYGKCGTLEDAFKAFACVKDQNTIMWTAMICACTKQGNFNTALLIYNNMLQEGGLPDTVTYSSVLDSCIAKGTLKIVRQIHAALVVNTLPCDIIATTSLLNMYGHHGSLEDASFIFDEMKQRTPSAWTSMIASYTQHGKSKEAIQLYVHMVMDGIPSEIMTFWRVLDACADQGSVIEGRLIHVVLVENGLECNLSLATALVVMYSKCEELEEGHYVFNHMQEKNLTSWTAMISAYAQFGADMEALFLVDEMLQEGMLPNTIAYVCFLTACVDEAHINKALQMHTSISHTEFLHDVVVMTALVSVYGKCGRPDEARRVFDFMNVKNVVSWNAMVAVYHKCGYNDKILNLLEKMLSVGIIPGRISLVCILDACSSEISLSKGEQAHLLIVKGGYDVDTDMGNAILNMYGKCGRLKDAHEVFNQIHDLDVISWNTIIGIWGRHGHPGVVFSLFDEMLLKGHSPDNITYVAVLSVCSHYGLISEGVHYFNFLMKDYNMAPTAEHCHCMIYMFTRAGQMQEGESFLQTLPIQPSSVTWTSLLNSFKGLPDFDRGEYIAQHAIELDEENASPYVMLSNIYAAWRDEAWVRIAAQ